MLGTSDITNKMPERCKSRREKKPKIGTGILGNVNDIIANVKLVNTVTPCKGIFGL
jgi:hypothetical protein